MNLLNIRSAADFRAFLYVALPTVVGLLVTTGTFDNTAGTLWTALVLALLGPVVAAFNARSVSGFRTAFYAVLGAGSAILIYYGAINEGDVAYWMPIISAVLQLIVGGVATANTDTTPAAGPALPHHSYSDTSDLGLRE